MATKNTTAQKNLAEQTAKAMEMYHAIYDTEERNIEYFTKRYNENVAKYNAATEEEKNLIAEGAARHTPLEDVYIRTLELAGATSEMVGNVIKATRGSKPQNNMKYIQYRMEGLLKQGRIQFGEISNLEVSGADGFLNENLRCEVVSSLIKSKRCGVTSEVAGEWCRMIKWVLVGYELQEDIVRFEDFNLRRFNFVSNWIKNVEK